MTNESQETGRRSFIKAGSMAVAGLATAASANRVLGANDRIRVAICGLRGRGWDHVKGYQPIPGVEIAYFCDVDENVLGQRLADAEKLGIAKPQTYTDVRKLLDDKNVDAISIATPNHWHSLMGDLGLPGGQRRLRRKAVLAQPVRRPPDGEGRRKYKLIVQHGSQCRSSDAIREAMQHMRNGLIGDVYMSRGLCYKWRDTIGRTQEEPIPAGVHYDLWTGPAPLKPFTQAIASTISGTGSGTPATATSATRASTKWIWRAGASAPRCRQR